MSAPGGFPTFDPPADPPPTRAEFLAAPNGWYYSFHHIPDAWIAEAWESDAAFRDNVTYEFVREASKNGDLYLLDDALAALVRILPTSRTVEVYEAVRRRSPDREYEFRPAFERALGERMAALPAPLPRDEYTGPSGREGTRRWDDDIPY